MKKTLRNPLHNHPLLRKCEVHDKKKRVQRRKDKLALREVMCGRS